MPLKIERVADRRVRGEESLSRSRRYNQTACVMTSPGKRWRLKRRRVIVELYRPEVALAETIAHWPDSTPARGGRLFAAPEVLCDLRPELDHPATDSLVTYVDPALRQHLLYVAEAEGEADLSDGSVRASSFTRCQPIGRCPPQPAGVRRNLSPAQGLICTRARPAVQSQLSLRAQDQVRPPHSQRCCAT